MPSTPPTRFPGGLAVVPASDPVFRNVGVPLSKVWAADTLDFLRPIDVGTGGEFTHTQTNGTLSYEGPNGVLIQTLGGADNDLSQIYLSAAPLAFVAGKEFAFEARVRFGSTGNVTLGEEELVIGLTSAQTGTNFMAADGLSRTFDNGCAFVSFDGSTSFTLQQGQGDTFSTVANAFTYAYNTWYRFGIRYDGLVTAFFVDDVKVGELATNLSTSAVTPMLFIKAGEAVAKTLRTDYISFASER